MWDAKWINSPITKKKGWKAMTLMCAGNIKSMTTSIAIVISTCG